MNMWNVTTALGKSFLVAGLLPGLAFFALGDLAIVPRLLGVRHLVDFEFLGVKGVVYVVGAIFLGFLLLSLNAPIIKLYEHGLLVSTWLLRRNRKQHRQRYTALTARQKAYRQAIEDGRNVEEAIAKLEAVHEEVERAFVDVPRLPRDADSVMPTALGNAFAVIEEYPYERYGMDAMVYWPRIAGVIPEEYKSLIGDLKTTLDFLLNLSLLAGLFGLALLGTAAWFGVTQDFVYGLLAMAVAYGLYRPAVGSAHQLGDMIMSCFDLFRGELLEQYGLPRPASLAAERLLWRQLASFIRRGEEFYFPSESGKQDDRVELRHDSGRAASEST